MSDEPPPATAAPVTLEFLSRQRTQLLTGKTEIKADILVLTTIALRVDNTLQSLVLQLDAMHADHRRTRDRMCALEAKATTE